MMKAKYGVLGQTWIANRLLQAANHQASLVDPIGRADVLNSLLDDWLP